MTNQERMNLKPFPLCDGHIHITVAQTADDTVKILENLMTYFNYERIAILGAQTDSKGLGDPANNLKALYAKSVINAKNTSKQVYAFSGIYHLHNELDTADNYLKQVRDLHEMGFDGIKMLEGKPKLRKDLGKRLDDPVFDKMYAYAEEHDIPITMHLGDPPEFWDINKISEYALKVGWFCDETYPKLEEMRDEVYGILRKFPKLRLTMAHFFFLSQDLEECVRLFETYPNLSFDVTPGGEMFKGFSTRPDDWREFFIKYAERIYLGTDTYNTALYDDLTKYGDNAQLVRLNLVRRCLETSQPIEHNRYGMLYPLALDDRTLMTIYHDNFVSRLGEPRKINFEAAADNVPVMRNLITSGMLRDPSDERNALELANLDVIQAYFK